MPEITDQQQTAGAEVDIYIMPKRFTAPGSATPQARKIGLFVVVGGVLFLAVSLALLYYYLIGPGVAGSVNEENNTVSSPNLTEEENIARNNGPEEKKDSPAAKEEYEGGGGGAAATTSDEKDEEISVIPPEITGKTEEAATGTAANEEMAVSATSAPEMAVSADGDGDGLSDAEEILLSCNKNAPDSDSDGYGDLEETLNLYNPAGSGSIMANPNIEKYINSQYGYALYYPFSWTTEEMGGPDSVIFKTGNNQFMHILIQPNAEGESINDWYEKQLEIDIIKNEQIIYKKGWQGVLSEDGLTAYLSRPYGEYIFVISYNTGLAGAADYHNAFSMMIKSLEMSN